VVIVLGVTAVACCAVVWRISRFHPTSPVDDVAANRMAAEVRTSMPAGAVGRDADSNSRASDRQVAGMDRKAYDALARRTWELLERGDAWQLVQDLARGKGLDDIRNDSLRALVSAKLEPTDEDYSKKKIARSTSYEAAIQKKIAAGNFGLDDPGMHQRDNKSPDADPARSILLSVSWDLPNGSWIHVDLFEGEAPEFEKADRELKLIESQREKEITQIFEDHGLLSPAPSK